MPASSYQQQKLRVCEVCSAYLGIHDNDRRLADHFGGKLHLGFIKIREKLSELEVNETCYVIQFSTLLINEETLFTFYNICSSLKYVQININVYLRTFLFSSYWMHFEQLQY